MKRPAQRPRQTAPADTTPRPAENFPFSAKSGGEAAAASSVQQGIFDATERLLQSTSLGDLTVAHILAEAGVSRTTFYRYFTSKHMVVSALLTNVQSELVDVMRPWSVRGDRNPADALWEAIEAVAVVWSQHRPVLRAASECFHSEPEVGRQFVAMMDGFVVDVARQIDTERANGVAPEGIDSVALARQLAWGGERMMYLAGFGICGPGLENDAVDPLVAVWVGAIYKK